MWFNVKYIAKQKLKLYKAEGGRETYPKRKVMLAWVGRARCMLRTFGLEGSKP